MCEAGKRVRREGLLFTDDENDDRREEVFHFFFFSVHSASIKGFSSLLFFSQSFFFRQDGDGRLRVSPGISPSKQKDKRRKGRKQDKGNKHRDTRWTWRETKDMSRKEKEVGGDERDNNEKKKRRWRWSVFTPWWYLVSEEWSQWPPGVTKKQRETKKKVQIPEGHDEKMFSFSFRFSRFPSSPVCLPLLGFLGETMWVNR